MMCMVRVSCEGYNNIHTYTRLSWLFFLFLYSFVLMLPSDPFFSCLPASFLLVRMSICIVSKYYMFMRHTDPCPVFPSKTNMFVIGCSFLERARSMSCASIPPTTAHTGESSCLAPSAMGLDSGMVQKHHIPIYWGHMLDFVRRRLIGKRRYSVIIIVKIMMKKKDKYQYFYTLDLIKSEVKKINTHSRIVLETYLITFSFTFALVSIGSAINDRSIPWSLFHGVNHPWRLSNSNIAEIVRKKYGRWREHEKSKMLA